MDEAIQDQILIRRQPQYVAEKRIPCQTALESEALILEHKRCHLGEQARSAEIGWVHGLSTSKPSAGFDTQGRLLPVGSVAGSSFAAQDREDSLPS